MIQFAGRERGERERREREKREKEREGREREEREREERESQMGRISAAFCPLSEADFRGKKANFSPSKRRVFVLWDDLALAITSGSGGSIYSGLTNVCTRTRLA